jgi:polyphosphate kinase 2 (PPK2 family)
MAKIDAALFDRVLRSYRVTNGKGFRLRDHDPGDTHGFKSEQKAEARSLLARGIEWLAEEQEKLYAQDRWGVLLVFQAMDAAGKDGTIEHVMSGVNPQGVQVTSFKAPSSEELDHDFMWRCIKALPERGRIGIFNRSWYEEALVVRVHEDLLARQHAPWYVVPADNKWFTHLVVAAAIVHGIDQLDLRYPAVDPAVAKEFAQCRKALVAEKE